MNQNNSGEKNTEIPLMSVIRLFVRKLHIIVLPSLVCALVVFLLCTFFVTPKYETQFKLSVTNKPKTKTGEITLNDYESKELKKTTIKYSHYLTSAPSLNAVLKELGDEKITRQMLDNMIYVDIGKDEHSLVVTVTATDKESSFKIANTFAALSPKMIAKVAVNGGAEVIESPKIPTEKATPRPTEFSIVSFIVVALVVMIILLLKMYNDPTIYVEQDVKALTDQSVLGVVSEKKPFSGEQVTLNIMKGSVVKLGKKKTDNSNK